MAGVEDLTASATRFATFDDAVKLASDSEYGMALGILTSALVGAATINGIARQPEAQARLYTTMFLIIGLCEAAYFINVAFMAMFVFALS
ncbi:MAG: hypothetical protein ACRDTA_07030 [Pseudonocardiaceae bacterium]